MQVLEFTLLQRICKNQKSTLSRLVIDSEKTNKQQKFKMRTHKEFNQLFYAIYFNWEDFYGKELTQPTYDNATYCQSENCENKTQLTPEGDNAWISNCYFYDMSSSSSGGAICTTSVENFLIEFSSFVNCKATSSSSSNGGAIWSMYGNIVLYHVCGTNCYSAYYQGCFESIHNVSSIWIH